MAAAATAASAADKNERKRKRINQKKREVNQKVEALVGLSIDCKVCIYIHI